MKIYNDGVQQKNELVVASAGISKTQQESFWGGIYQCIKITVIRMNELNEASVSNGIHTDI